MKARFKPKYNIRKGDSVVVITGDDKDLSKPRTVKEVLVEKGKVIVEVMGGGAQGQNPFADIMRQMQEMQQQQGGSTYRDSSIIDGEAREVTPEAKKIEMKDVNK